MELKNRDQWGDKEYGLLESLKLRYFTPREIACLLCFPPFYGKCLNVISLIKKIRYKVSVNSIIRNSIKTSIS